MSKDNKKSGFIALYRSLQDNPIWCNGKPFSDGQAWVDILLSVNHKDNFLQVGCSIVTIHAGQMWTSFVKLANRWVWSRERVYRYIKMLKKAGMIYVDATPNGTLLTVRNWDFYNGVRNTNETTNETANETSSETSNETTGETQTIMNNNVNNEKEVNKRPAPPRGGGEWQ